MPRTTNPALIKVFTMHHNSTPLKAAWEAVSKTEEPGTLANAHGAAAVSD